jgi:hypothetical protein
MGNQSTKQKIGVKRLRASSFFTNKAMIFIGRSQMSAGFSVRKIALVATIAAAAIAMPCINDLDTKRIEQETRFDVRSMVAGRYEVNPPVYFEMRVERLKK